jgi:hypothetical protein
MIYEIIIGYIIYISPFIDLCILISLWILILNKKW